MSAFPKLKTGAVAQYPASRSLRFQNQVLRFVDGTEQRYRDSSGLQRNWVISLDQLDEGEMAAIDEFFAQNQGRLGSFEFTDPWDGSVHANCSFATDDLILTCIAEMQGRASLTVMENRA
jgi:hypothetical protein